MKTGAPQRDSSGPNLETLGLKSSMEVIDILAALKIDGNPVIKDDKALLNPQVKAEEVMHFFNDNFNVKPSDLPYLASVIKQDIRAGKIRWKA